MYLYVSDLGNTEFFDGTVLTVLKYEVAALEFCCSDIAAFFIEDIEKMRAFRSTARMLLNKFSEWFLVSLNHTYMQINILKILSISSQFHLGKGNLFS